MSAQSRIAGALLPAILGSLVAGILVRPSVAKGQVTTAAEITTQETQPTFKFEVQRNMVLVRAVVRDSKGRPVPGLRKEDFRLFDNGKPQVISQFAVESPSVKLAKELEAAPREPDAETLDESSLASSTPHDYLALYFDDVHMEFQDIVRSRDAADRYLASALQREDRVGVFSSSGQTMLDFTDDRGKLHAVLFQLRPRPVVTPQQRDCPDINDYLAYLIVFRRDPDAIAVATEETYICRYENIAIPSGEGRARAQNEAEAYAMQALNLYETNIGYALRGLGAVVRRMAALPGRRSIIFICPGFLSYTVQQQAAEISDRALRSNVIINTLDSKGLFAPIPLGDASQSPTVIARDAGLVGRKQQYILDGYAHATEVLASFASDTGGEFFHNNNDLDQGIRQLAALMDVYYTLAFSPQNLKLDGRFHSLKVALVKPAGMTVQARRGYFAPKKTEDPSARAKEEIEQALFSHEEQQELPVDVHTQFFKLNDTDARVSVLTHLDLHPLHFRKEAGRNLNNVTFVTGLFDRDGKLVAGREKRLELRLLDTSLDRLLQTGLNTRTSFDVKPGTYLVRQVVRDAEGGQISGLNRTVEIPY